MGAAEVRQILFGRARWKSTSKSMAAKSGAERPWGVEPDVKVKAAQALETAEKLAESKLQRK